MKRLNHALESPFLLMVLVALFAALGARWYRADAAQYAPPLSGYDWTKHANALLIVVPPDACGCGGPPSDSIKKAIALNMDVVVIASAFNDEIKQVKATHFSTKHVQVFTNAAPDVITRFAAHKKTVFINVHQGRMVYQSGNGLAPDLFKMT